MVGRRAETGTSPGASRPASLENTAVNKKTRVMPEVVSDLHGCKMAHRGPRLCTSTYKHKHQYLKHTERYHEDVSFGD